MLGLASAECSGAACASCFKVKVFATWCHVTDVSVQSSLLLPYSHPERAGGLLTCQTVAGTSITLCHRRPHGASQIHGGRAWQRAWSDAGRMHE